MVRVEFSSLILLTAGFVVLWPISGLTAEDGAQPAATAGSNGGSGLTGTPPDFGTVGSGSGSDTSVSSPDNAYARPSPFAYGAASYQPGFNGCATTDVSFRGASAGGFYTALKQPEGPAEAQGRFVRLSISGAEIYTDNLTLAPDDRAISDFIFEISPRLDACASTGRARGSFTYEPQGLIYSKNSRFNRVYHNVAGDTTIQLLAGHLYLGADTSYSQTTLDPSASFSTSNALRPGNRTGVWTSNVSPYYVQGLGPVGDASLRYRFGKTIYGESSVPDATINGVYFDLVSPQDRGAISWQANAFTQRVRRSGGDPQQFFRRIDESGPLTPDNTFIDSANNSRTQYFDKATLQLGYQVGPKLELVALGGVEDDYRPDGTNDRLGSALWNVGFIWASAENSLEARVGHRYFGTSYFVRAAHRGRVFDASLDYREEPSSQGLNSLNSNGISNNTSFRQPVTSQLDQGVFLEKTVTASLAFDTGRTRTTLRAFDERREFVANLPNETFVGGDIQFDYQLRPRTAIIPRAGWERRKVRSGIRTDTADVGASLVQTISPTAQAALSYGHSWRRADTAAREYDENRAVIQLQKIF